MLSVSIRSRVNYTLYTMVASPVCTSRLKYAMVRVLVLRASRSCSWYRVVGHSCEVERIQRRFHSSGFWYSQSSQSLQFLELTRRPCSYKQRILHMCYVLKSAVAFVERAKLRTCPAMEICAYDHLEVAHPASCMTRISRNVYQSGTRLWNCKADRERSSHYID